MLKKKYENCTKRDGDVLGNILSLGILTTHGGNFNKNNKFKINKWVTFKPAHSTIWINKEWRLLYFPQIGMYECAKYFPQTTV